MRRDSGAKVIAITGSAGKTSTKELIADLLAARYRVMRNRGNLNNHIGLPLSLTELSSGPDIAVVELGMNHAGEIRALVGLARPDMRVWTNVGDAHIGHFGSREAVARAKAEILEGASADAVAVVNADDPLVMAHAHGFPGRVVTFGLAPSATVHASRVVDRGFDGTSADIETAAGRIRLEAGLPGRAHLLNALAAVAVALEFGVPPAAIASRLAAARAVPRRGSQATLHNGARIIDDSYNASPAALDAMLHALAATKTAGRRIAVLGEMLELGEAAVALHDSCGRIAAECGVDVLVAVGGPAADGLIAGALAAGMPAGRTHRYPDAASACAPVAALVGAGDLVLVKGSRGTRTDLIADAPAGAGNRLMLFHLLHEYLGINVVGYTTFRTAVASLTALAISILLGPWFIRRLRAFQVGQVVRTDGPASHKPKAGTPTMGGLLILAAVFMPTLLWADLRNPHIWMAVGATAAFGAIGFVDDYLKVTRHSAPRPLRPVQVCVADRRRDRRRRGPGHDGERESSAVRHAVALSVLQAAPAQSAWWYVPFAVLVLVATTNAVNLTDGLDGLAISTFAVSAGAYTALAYVTGHAAIAKFLLLPALRIHQRADDLLRIARGREPRASSGGTPIPLTCSWATSDRSDSAARLGRSRC